MKYIFLIISALLSVTVAQDPVLRCQYISGGTHYTCFLAIINPSGLNNFTEVGGTHVEPFTDADVRYISTFSGRGYISPNLPNIICDTFNNLDIIDLFSIGLTYIDDTSFTGCPKVTSINFVNNRISTVSAKAFINLPQLSSLTLPNNLLTTLPENVFVNQQNLTWLNIGRNPFEHIPTNLFRPLINLDHLFLDMTNITTINRKWFAANSKLSALLLCENRITLSANSFLGLGQLTHLRLCKNGINSIPIGTFARLPNLRQLDLTGNNFTELNAISFPNLENLNELFLSSCGIRTIHSNTFRTMVNLTLIQLHFNPIEELPIDVFASNSNLEEIGLFNNRLKTLRRNSFGVLTSLLLLNLNDNGLNGLDRAIIDDAIKLTTLHFSGNLCADKFFDNFQRNRPQNLLILERCFSNMENVRGNLI